MISQILSEYKCEDGLYNRLFSNPFLQTINKYREHPSINTFCHHFRNFFASFYLSPVDKNIVLNEIKVLSANKAVQESFERKCKPFCRPWIFQIQQYNTCFQTRFQNLKDNYRPKKLMCKQLLPYFDNIFSIFHSGFRKGFGTQYCLLLMIHKWKKAVKSLIQLLSCCLNVSFPFFE